MYASGAYICAYAIERRISTRIGVPHLREGVIEMVEAWGRGMPLIRVLSATVQSAIIFVPNQAGWF